jgi:osmoprotectant transport system permease protein
VIAEIAAWFSDPAHWSGPNGIPTRVLEHVEIAFAALAIAAAIGLPVGIWIGHTRRHVRFAINLANLGRAVPSLAAIAIIVPITQAISPKGGGFDLYPTITAMVLLAIPPILVNTYAGIAEVDRDLVESARGMGLREREILRGVELPIALPVVIGGIRSAAVQVIATATLGAIYGLGALGRYIISGLQQNDANGMLFGGVILVTLLALSAEGLLALAQRRLTSPGLRPTAG